MGCRRVGIAVALLGLAGTAAAQTGAPASSASFPPPAAAAATTASPSATGPASAVPPANAPPASSPTTAAPSAAPPLGAPPPPPGYAPYPPYPYPPPYYYPWPPPGAYEAPKDPHPLTLPYEEGREPPPGYHFESRVRRGPVIAGSLMFGITYGLQLLVASANDFNDSSEWLLVPVLGSWVFMEEECNRGSDDGCTFLALHGLTQTAGAVLLVYGLASRKKLFVRDEVGVQLAPARLGSGYGFSASGRF